MACDLGGSGLNLVGVAYDLAGRGSTSVSVAGPWWAWLELGRRGV